jgi:hypothetical protein
MDIAKLRERTYLLQCLRIKMSSAASLAAAASHVRGGKKESEMFAPAWHRPQLLCS